MREREGEKESISAVLERARDSSKGHQEDKNMQRKSVFFWSEAAFFFVTLSSSYM